MMRRIRVVMMAGCLGITAFTIVTGAGDDGLDNWRNAISTNDFKKTLVSVKSLQEDWPAVHSVKHKENKDEAKALVQTGYRNMARTFWQGLESYEKVLQEMSPEAFCEAADALLDVRNRFLKHPSYVNYFLIDSINRVIYINLGERLAMVGDVPTCYDRLVERLAEFRCDLSTIGNLVSVEYGSDRFSMATIEEMPFEKKLDAIGVAIGQDMSFLFLPQDIHNMYGLRILEKCSLTALSRRLALSDHCIGASLPALLSFRRKTMVFTATDSFPQIRAVLGDEVWLPPTLLPGRHRAVIEASDFLTAIRSEHWREKLCFSESPAFFAKGLVEQLEREEAEREAKREASQK
ncbi:MAG: hypothetical protein FWG50_10730 [Kiritimatiellaeota bacterium]|nr:hypothetical protein [Kiritimatiellota bacterium]